MGLPPASAFPWPCCSVSGAPRTRISTGRERDFCGIAAIGFRWCSPGPLPITGWSIIRISPASCSAWWGSACCGGRKNRRLWRRRWSPLPRSQAGWRWDFCPWYSACSPVWKVRPPPGRCAALWARIFTASESARCCSRPTGTEWNPSRPKSARIAAPCSTRKEVCSMRTPWDTWALWG